MRKIAIKYGLYMLGGFIAFFLLMYLIGLSGNTWLRIFNGFIHMGFVYLAIKEYREKFPDGINNYVSGVATGMFTSLYGVIGFSIFILLFLIYSPTFFNDVKNNIPIGQYITPITGTLFILAEGIVISLIGSYILTRIIDDRLVKNSR